MCPIGCIFLPGCVVKILVMEDVNLLLLFCPLFLLPGSGQSHASCVVCVSGILVTITIVVFLEATWRETA